MSIEDQPPFMKGQKCSNSAFVITLTNYCLFNPPTVTSELSGLSRQSTGLIFRKLGKRMRSLIPNDFMHEIYRRMTLFESSWIEENVIHLSSFGDLFFDGFTKWYYDRNPLKDRSRLDETVLWEFVTYMHKKWGRLPRKTLDDHIGLPFYTTIVTLQIHVMYEHAVENNQLEDFYAAQRHYHPYLPSDFDEMKKFGNVALIVADTMIENLRIKQLD